MNTTQLQIITPNGLFYNGSIEIVTVRTTDGEIGLMYGKSPLVASLAISDLHIGQKNKENYKICAIAGGILYATPTSIRIITDAIEYKDQIDIHRAEIAKRKAEDALKNKLANSEATKVKLALTKAINRINVKNGLY